MRGGPRLLSRDPALSLAPILGVIFVTGMASGFERPALTAFEAQVIPREQAVQGVSYQASVSQTGYISGPHWVASPWRSSASWGPTA